MRLNPPRVKRSLRDILVDEYKEWHSRGRPKPITARVITGMYYELYRKRYRLYPITKIQLDIDAFESMLALLHEDLSLAPYCLEALFAIKEFNMRADAFCNPNVIEKWNVVERAHKIRNSNGVGEQAEFRSDNPSRYGVIRV